MDSGDVFGQAFEALVLRGDVSDYLDMLGPVSETVDQVDGTRLDVLLSRDVLLNERRIRLALTLGDLVCLYPSTETVFLAPAERYPISDELLGVVPGLADALRHHGDVGVLYGFANFNEQLRIFEGWARAGRVVVRPLPMLSFNDRHGRQLRLATEPELPGHLLPVSRYGSKRAQVPIRERGTKSTQDILLAPIAIPFLDGVPLDVLMKVIDDEKDALQDMRLALRQLLNALPKEQGAAEAMVADSIRPAVSRVERRFRTVTRSHGLRVAGATVGTAALGLVPLTGNSTAAALSTVFGGAGLTVLANEVAELIKARADAREMPYYFLWRLSRRAGGRA